MEEYTACTNWKANEMKTQILSKLTYKFSTILFKLPESFIETDKLILNCNGTTKD